MSEHERRQEFLEAEAVVRELADELTRTESTRQEVESLVRRLEQILESLSACRHTMDRARDQLAAAQEPLLQAANQVRDAVQRLDTQGAAVQRSVAELADIIRAGHQAAGQAMRELEARLDTGFRRQRDQLAAAQEPLLQAANQVRDAVQRLDTQGAAVQRSVAELADIIRAGHQAAGQAMRELEARLDTGFRRQFVTAWGLAAAVLLNLLLGGICLVRLLVR
jgi:DNA repair exonuclease SbcCD ATPase subunit